MNMSWGRVLMCVLRRLFSWTHIRSSFKSFLKRFLAVAGGIHLIVQILLKAVDPFVAHCGRDVAIAFQKFAVFVNGDFYAALITFAVLYAFVKCLPRMSASARIRGTDIVVRVAVREILKQGCDFALTCSRTFDTDTEKFVKSPSLQYDFQEKFFPGKMVLDKCIGEQVKGLKVEKKLQRGSKRKQYPIGTVAKVAIPDSQLSAFLVAIPRSTGDGGAVGCFTDFQIGVERLWRAISSGGVLKKLAVPVFGTGRSGLTNSGMSIIQEIVRSFVAVSRNSKIADELVICVYPADVSRMKIDFEQIQKYLDVECGKEPFLSTEIPAGTKELT